MRERILPRSADVTLTVGAVIGACCLLVTLASLIFGVQPLIFRSGSMSPAIPAGSLAIARPVDGAAIRPGDVVSVPYRDSRVTHRVVAVDRAGGDAVSLRLRGDANESADPQPYRVREVDRVMFAVPFLGSVINWLSHPPGVFVLAGYAAVLLALIFRRGSAGSPRAKHAAPADRTSDDRGGHHRSSAERRSIRRTWLRPVGLGTALLGVTSGLAVSPTWAAFTDPVPVSGTVIQTATITAPGNLRCGLLGLASVTVNWNQVPNATNYTVFYNSGNSTATTTNTSFRITAVATNATVWVVANRNFGSTTWTSAPSSQRTYTVALGLLGLCA